MENVPSPAVKRGQTSEIINDTFDKLQEIISTRPTDERNGFLNILREIRNRYDDPEFRLAVIGNFSCGKSTFLNALLEEDLLSMSDLPTTAIPTYIRWNRDAEAERRAASFFQKRHVPDNKTPTVTVTLLDGERYLLYGKRRKQFESRMKLRLPSEPGAMIDFITTTTTLAASIKSVEMSFPYRERFANFCLIDTPGMNPGEEENKDHILQTQSVLRDEADVAIVLYTAKDAMSRDTREFLEENAEHLMKDAVIMLTKMDLVPERQRDKLQKNTARLIGNQFGQENPVVYMISAGRALDYLCGYDQNPNEREISRQWAAQFDETMRQVLIQLHERRIDIVAHRITQLMTNLIDSISHSINSDTEKLTTEANQLEKASFQNLEEKVQELYENFKQSLERDREFRYAQANGLVRASMETAETEIRSRISSTSNQHELDDCLNNYYPNKMRQAAEEIDSAVRQQVIGSMKNLSAEYSKSVEECLEAYKRKLGSVGTFSVQVTDAVTGSETLSFSVSESSFVGNHAGVLLGVLGTLALGPVALLGGFLFDRFLFSGRKDSAKSSVSAKVYDVTQELQTAYQQLLDEAEAQYVTWAQKILSSYVSRYRKEFEQIEREHKAREQSVNDEIKQNNGFIRTMDDLKTRIASL